MYGDTKVPYISVSSSPSRGPCVNGNVTGGPEEILISPNDLIFPAGKINPACSCFLLGGACEAGSDATFSTMTLCTQPTNDFYTPGEDGCAYVLDIYENNASRSPSIGCTKGWKTGYSYTFQNAGAYFLKQDVPQGNFNLHRKEVTRDFIIAKNVRQFEVTYGLDLSIPMDGKLDGCPDCVDDPLSGIFPTNLSWCRDLNSRCNMKLSDGSPLTADTAYNRIVAVHVSFIVFKDTPADGIRYQTTISLKNRLSR